LERHLSTTPGKMKTASDQPHHLEIEGFDMAQAHATED
jgi:hypothetical protein